VGVLALSFLKKKIKEKTREKTNKCLMRGFGRSKSAGPFLAPNIPAVIIIIIIITSVIVTATVV